jgi:hypothetical protein
MADHAAPDVIAAGEHGVLGDDRLLAAPPQRVGDDETPRFERPGFCRRAARRRGRKGPPVVEDLGDVDDAPCPLGGAQREVVVLAAVELAAQAAELVDERPAHHRPVADVGVAEEEVG